MSSTRYCCAKFLGSLTIVLFGSCTFAIAAVGQGKPDELPAKCSAYSSVPLPAEAKKVPVPSVSPVCASYRSYRGIGRPVNYSAARKCAWQERLAQQAGLGQNPKEPDAWVVGGSLILADIYFNGAGVRRNIPLAMRFACEFEKGTAMFALPAIKKFESSPRTHRPFEFCDYAATTFTADFCIEYKSEIGDARKNRYYNSLKASMTPEQRGAFEALLAAENAYIEAHASEVYQGGTISAIRTIRSQGILKDLFHAEIVHFEHKKWPVLSRNQITRADALLQGEYEKKLQQLRAQSKESIDEGAVTAGGISSAEKAWTAYRDAWVVFAHLRYPTAASAIRAQITLDRYRLVKTIQ